MDSKKLLKTRLLEKETSQIIQSSLDTSLLGKKCTRDFAETIKKSSAILAKLEEVVETLKFVSNKK